MNYYCCELVAFGFFIGCLVFDLFVFCLGLMCVLQVGLDLYLYHLVCCVDSICCLLLLIGWSALTGAVFVV